MPRGVAINVGANTGAPGFRGPIDADGRFTFVPIPESEPADGAPTYADLDLPVEIPPETCDAPVHLDPEFAEYPHCREYTYGDPYAVKARPLLDLDAGDYAFFYATLRTRGEPARDWIADDWGAYLIGQFRLARDPVPGETFADLRVDVRDRFANNAHCKRRTFDAAVLLLGEPAESRLYDVAFPLSDPARGVDANRIVTELSSDSGKGPWWRRPLRFSAASTADLLDRLAAHPDSHPRA